MTESRWIKEQLKCPCQAASVTHVTTVAEFGNDLLARASGCVKSRPRVSLADFCRHRVRHHPRPAVSQVPRPGPTSVTTPSCGVPGPTTGSYQRHHPVLWCPRSHGRVLPASPPRPAVSQVPRPGPTSVTTPSCGVPGHTAGSYQRHHPVLRCPRSHGRVLPASPPRPAVSQVTRPGPTSVFTPSCGVPGPTAGSYQRHQPVLWCPRSHGRVLPASPARPVVSQVTRPGPTSVTTPSCGVPGHTAGSYQRHHPVPRCPRSHGRVLPASPPRPAVSQVTRPGPTSVFTPSCGVPGHTAGSYQRLHPVLWCPRSHGRVLPASPARPVVSQVPRPGPTSVTSPSCGVPGHTAGSYQRHHPVLWCPRSHGRVLPASPPRPAVSQVPRPGPTSVFTPSCGVPGPTAGSYQRHQPVLWCPRSHGRVLPASPPRPVVSQVSCHFTSPAASPLAAAEHKAAPLSGPLSAAALSEEPRGGAGDLTAPGTDRQRP